jgi:hypothetical protein
VWVVEGVIENVVDETQYFASLSDNDDQALTRQQLFFEGCASGDVGLSS